MSKANKLRSEAMKAKWAKRRELGVVGVTHSVKTSSAPHTLTGDEINAIIDRCAAKGVLSFQYGQLQLLFKKSLDVPKTDHTRGTGGDALDDVDGVSSATRQGALQGLSDLAAEELEHLKITDPAAYEDFIQSGEAENATQ